MKKITKLIAAAVVCLASSSAMASLVQINAIPSTWRLEESVSTGTFDLYFTGAASCTNGKLSLPSTSTEAERNRLYSLVLLAKVSASTMFVYYETSTCVIAFFGKDS